ncbi:hypothetical protein LEP1GSC047_2129 [Leptospira inadai serovar Lyme str. 10]|uniref:Uncharacterized protein n=2 Tax=Leptospira inadai serovar Lyme TaxID=293084 RepID=V6I0D6_9LEPT|nr:hypothetical protein [Leptospira inadai]EQA38734.1 hypothetical protein LEP1GSC047_2129 [Leptospira inadai serovar Lyme str. 10]PNV72634.1 serine/threonine protein kinase [Leptospira inadai serovar Lyme]
MTITATNRLALSLSPVDSNQNGILYVPNADGESVSAENYFTLTITNNGSAPISLKGGEPVPDGQTSGAASLLVVYLPESIGADSLPSIRLNSPANWKLKSFTDDGNYLVICPASDSTLPAGGVISLTLIGFVAAPRQIPQKLAINVLNVDASAVGTGEYDFDIFIQQVPKKGNKDLSIESRTIDGNIVFITPGGNTANSENSINFYILNSGRSLNAIPAKANQTYIRISFDTGNGMGDIAEAADLEGITVNIQRAYENGFTLNFERIGQIPTWKFTAATDVFLNGGSNDRIEFDIQKLVTHLSPGIAKCYIEYYNIPGYNDGYSDFTLTKEYPEAIITGFFASSYAIVGGTEIVLQWETEGASYCTLEAATGSLLDENNQIIPAFQSFPTLESGIKIIPVPPAVIPASGGIVFSISLHAFSLDGRSSSKELGIQILPPGCNLSASNLNPVPPGTSVTLSWTSQNARTLTIDPGIGTVKDSGDIVVSPKNTTQYTLTATGLRTVTSSVVVTVDVLVINYFRPSAYVVGIGEPVTISWDVAFAISVTLNGSKVANSGSADFPINSYQTFTLVCQGKDGTSLTQSFDVEATGAM